MIDHRDVTPPNSIHDGAPAVMPRMSLEAERSVLGGLLLDGSRVPAVRAILSPADMYHPANEVILGAIYALDKRGEPIDVVTLAAELRGRLNTVGGMQYLGDLTDYIPTAAHIEAHARAVGDLAELRRLKSAALEIIASVDDGRVTREQAVAKASRRITAALERRSVALPIPLSKAIDASFERLEKTLERGGRITGTSTGFRDLDSLLAGLHPGQLVIIAARPAMGKSSLALDMAHAVATGTDTDPGAPVLFVSLEMAAVELSNRLMCSAARIDQSRMRSNMLTQDDMNALTAAAGKLFQLPIHIVSQEDFDAVTLATLRAQAVRFKHTWGVGPEKRIGLIVVDYLQLMSGDGSEDSREREISAISRGLKLLALQLGVPVVALSQLNRAPEIRTGKSKRPVLSDLRESGAIEQDADVVIFIYRDEVYNKQTEDRGIAEIIVAKQRNGPTETVRLRFVRELTRFENLSEDDQFTGAAADEAPLPPEPDRREPRQAEWTQENF